MVYNWDNHTPQCSSTSFIAQSADVIGQVCIEDYASIWFQAVVRGDNDSISIGKKSNIQDGVVVHVDKGFPVRVGEGCVIGHKAILHGCLLGDNVLIGMGAILMNGCRIDSNTIVAAGSLVPSGKHLESGLYMGSPARKIRDLSPEDLRSIKTGRDHYVEKISGYKKLC